MFLDAAGFFLVILWDFFFFFGEYNIIMIQSLNLSNKNKLLFVFNQKFTVIEGKFNMLWPCYYYLWLLFEQNYNVTLAGSFFSDRNGNM